MFDVPKDYVPEPAPQGPLPPLNPFLARSTYATILLVISSLSATLGVDLLGTLGGWVGVEALTDTKVLKLIDDLLPVASGLWLWWERKNPSFRIGFK